MREGGHRDNGDAGAESVGHCDGCFLVWLDGHDGFVPRSYVFVFICTVKIHSAVEHNRSPGWNLIDWVSKYQSPHLLRNYQPYSRTLTLPKCFSPVCPLHLLQSSPP